MADQTARELKLVQYLNEAYGKEKQLETTLQAQIALAKEAARKPLQKRLQDHLRETKAQARGLEKRIKQLGGKAEAVDLPGPDIVSGAATGAANLANKALAAAKGPVQALRGTSPADNLLRNIRDAVWNEAEEIAHYDLIESLADKLNDKETVKLAKEYRRQEERMQKFLRGQIKALVGQVVKDEVPARDRRGAAATTTRRSTSSARKSTARKSTTSGARKSSGTSARKSSGTARKSSGTSSRSRASSSASSSRSSSASGGRKSSGSSARKSSGTSARKSSGTRKSSSRSTSRRSSGGSSSGGSSS